MDGYVFLNPKTLEIIKMENKAGMAMEIMGKEMIVIMIGGAKKIP